MEVETDIMQETIYGTPNDDNHVVMSEKVQTLAGSIYQEFEKMIGKYDEDVVKELMPLVVSVLENLDLSFMENQEHEVELELLREDNEQLVTQYEREKQLRKNSEQKLLEIEYAVEDDRRDLQGKVESLESIVRMLELKAKNASDHASRLEEKETEMRKEYTKLHERYTELFKTHMDYMERTKILFGTERLEAITNKSRHGLNISLLKNDSSLYNSNSIDVPIKSIVSPVDFPSIVSPNPSSSSNTSLKSELQDLQSSSAVTSPTSTNVDLRESLLKSSRNKNKETSEKGQLTDMILQSDRSTATRGGWIDGFESDLSDMLQPGFSTSPELEDIEDISQDISFGPETLLKKEHRGPNTLYQELSFHDNDALGENDDGDITDSDSERENECRVTDNFFGMGKEVENLIIENNELLATKNALNIVKDDLIAKVDELTSEQEILREEIKSLQTVKDRFKQKVTELEEELRKVKEENDKAKSSKSDDEEDVPMAQRKRFTRVEMARVLMERNQYKERLMELQEAVRWTEMIRASRNDPTIDTKRNRSSIWKFFGNLFNPNDKPLRKPMPYVNVRYNAPTAHVSPALDTMRKKRLGDRHRGLDFLDSELSSERLQQQRAKERREQYKQVRAHVRKEDGRMHAYGWSLPYKKPGSSKPFSNTESENKTKTNSSHIPVPVPVYCRPLFEKEMGIKIWCAAGVILAGGRITNGHSIKESKEISQKSFPITKSKSEMDKLSQTLQVEENHKNEQNEVENNCSSMVWICTSSHTNSKVTVVDANNPAEILNSFQVCSSHLLCIASVPGTKETDFVVNEEFNRLGTETATVSNETNCNDSSHKNNSTSTKIGKVTLVHSSPANVSVNANTLGNCQNTENANESTEFKNDKTVEIEENKTPVEKMSSVLPTMWLGSQNGSIYVHSSVAHWETCIHSVKMKDSVLSIIHFKGRVFAALADGTVAIFHRKSDGQWNVENYHLLDLGRPHHSVRCMSIVHSKIWCGYRNQIHVIDPKSLSLEKSFDAHPRKESQVRQMAWTGDGVWITIRLDSTLRLYHAHTHQHLQDVDVEPYVSKMLGTGKLGFSFVRITALLISCNRLWMGTGNGVVISVPLAERKKSSLTNSTCNGKTPGGVVRVYADKKDALTTNNSSFIPYCSMAQAQLSFHGHRDSVKFFVSVPGCVPESSDKNENDCSKQQEMSKHNYMLVMSGGEGYIDFRIGDGNGEEENDGMVTDVPTEKNMLRELSKGDRSHLIVWQVETPEKN